MADPYGSATSQVDESRKKLLEAVATAGTAGKKAYDDARAGINTQQQEALARAQQQAQLGGVTEAGLAELQGKTGASYGQQQNILGTQQAGFEGALQQTGASGASYLDKLQASLPALQEQNRMKIADKEAGIKQVIAEAQAAAEAKAAQQAEQNAFTLERDAFREKNANQRAAISQASKNAPKPLTVDQLLGAAVREKQRAQGIIGQSTGVAAPGVYKNARLDATGIQNLAQDIGRASQVDEATLAGIFAPSKNSSISTTIKNLSPAQKNAQADALAKKYASINVTPKVAADILKDKDFIDVMDYIMKGAEGKPREEVLVGLRKAFLEEQNKPRIFQILQDALNEQVPTAGSISSSRTAREKLAE
jgi:hypothetical protein